MIDRFPGTIADLIRETHISRRGAKFAEALCGLCVMHVCYHLAVCRKNQEDGHKEGDAGRNAPNLRNIGTHHQHSIVSFVTCYSHYAKWLNG